MVSRRLRGDSSMGDEAVELPLTAGLLVPENSRCVAQPLRKPVNSAAAVIHISDLCIAVPLGLFVGDRASDRASAWASRPFAHHVTYTSLTTARRAGALQARFFRKNPQTGTV